MGRSFLYEEEDCKSEYIEQYMHKRIEEMVEEKKRIDKVCGEEEEKLCEEFEAQASVFCESVESQSSVKGETSL